MEILIVDDEKNIRRMLRALLESEGYGVREAGSAEEGITAVREGAPEAVLLDLALPGMSGLEALGALREVAPGMPIVMMSGQASLSDAVTATRRGAFHFLEKPLTPEAVLVTLRGALEVGRARDLTRVLQEELGPGTELVGESPGIRQVAERIRKVAPTDARVLITGESGTGKELVATAIHGLSRRAGGAFVRVNSAAIPRDLVESEMFGHERGAFTGATERRRGRFELAHEGTLFLDEIADLSADAQAKLLRAIESGTIERVGGSSAIAVDVRLIAATHRDLRAEVEAGRFRDDLFFRLDVVPIHLPPLRERRGDIPLLVDYGLERLRKKHGLAAPHFDGEAMRALQEHEWPGNVRELLNVVERLAILNPGARVGTDAIREILPGRALGTPLPAQDGGARDGRADRSTPIGEAPLTDLLESYERELITSAIERSEGNVAEASRLLRTDRANLYRRMKRLGLREER